MLNLKTEVEYTWYNKGTGNWPAYAGDLIEHSLSVFSKIYDSFTLKVGFQMLLNPQIWLLKCTYKTKAPYPTLLWVEQEILNLLNGLLLY